jgi:(1->4)-alpha-D-glucan 1-alpha-D-glucosylmutase
MRMGMPDDAEQSPTSGVRIGGEMSSEAVGAPASTYRLQISARFTLLDAADLVPYLDRLGVGAVYVSPLLRSIEGSQHGYDVVDHRMVDPARGGDAGLQALSRSCRAAGVALIVDLVPNHMGVADPVQNGLWWQMLERGRSSPAAAWFDVDWEAGADRVLLPVGNEGSDDRPSLREDGLSYGGVRYPLAPGSGRDGDEPEEVLEHQHYRFIDPGHPGHDLNYRRFFAVSDLAGLRVEDPAVYRESHAEVLRWVRQYQVKGLRIDHPDGLADPAGYLERLADDAPGSWLTVEKILQPGEGLPDPWPVAGTTGYDALAEVNGLLVDPDAEHRVDQVYRQLTGDALSWADHVTEGKEVVVATLFRPEIDRLARLAAGTNADATRAALAAIAVAFPVYRSYLPDGRRHFDAALEGARRRHPELSGAVDALGPRLADPGDELCVRFQQLTGAVMAKGVEDTAYFRYGRQLSLNEVGGDPGGFGRSVEGFHDAQHARQFRAPSGMTTLSTHDTKWGEDVRARLAVLAEMPSDWAEAAEALMTLVPIPDRPLAYLLWQTFVATGLIERDRMHAFAEKAMREAATSTTWIDPDQTFESVVHEAIDAAYDRPEVRGIIESFARRIEPYGWSNALAQKLVQLTMPGVPDVYQGSEWGGVALVDPDNRRPVDFAALAAALDRLDSAPEGSRSVPRPWAKLWLTRQALRARRDHPRLFQGYEPVRLGGPLDSHPLDRHLVAFDRGGAITLATRLPLGLERSGGWRDARVDLPPGRYRNALTATRHQGHAELGAVFATYPVALLLAEPTG